MAVFFYGLNEFKNHEKPTLYYRGDLYYWMVVGSVCVERNRFDSYSYSACCYFIAIWHYQKSIGFSIQSFSYTRSILSARLQFSTVAIFFMKQYKLWPNSRHIKWVKCELAKDAGWQMKEFFAPATL